MDWFQFVAIMSNAAMNIHIQIFVWTYIFISLGWISRSGIARLYGKFIFDNLRYQQTVFQNDCAVFTFPQYMIVPVSPPPHQHLLLPLIIVIQVGISLWALFILQMWLIWICSLFLCIYQNTYTLLHLWAYKFAVIYIKSPALGLPWWSRSEESACQCRRHGFHSWSGRISYASEQRSLCNAATEACVPRAHSLQQEKRPQWEACTPQLESSPCLPREKACRRQWRPSTAKT